MNRCIAAGVVAAVAAFLSGASAALATHAPVRLWGIVSAHGTRCESDAALGQAIAEQLDQLGQPTEPLARETSGRAMPLGCAPADCAAAWPDSVKPLLGGFTERLSDNGWRGRLWLYEPVRGDVAYRDVLAADENQLGAELAVAAYALVSSPSFSDAPSPIPTYCRAPPATPNAALSPSGEACRALSVPRCQGPDIQDRCTAPGSGPGCRQSWCAGHAADAMCIAKSGKSPPQVVARKAFTFIFAGAAAVSLGLLIWQATQNNAQTSEPCDLGPIGKPGVYRDGGGCHVDTTAPLAVSGVLTGLFVIGAVAVWPYASKR